MSPRYQRARPPLRRRLSPLRMPYRPRRGRGGGVGRLIIAAIIAISAIVSFVGSRQYNPVTGEKQFVALAPQQEIALGLQAAPQMIQQHGGLHPDAELQAMIDRIGARLVDRSAARQTEWPFEFHLLADDQTVNAFALPGGPVFLTSALLSRLDTEGQVAGVLAHEIGHVVARHSAQQIAKSQLTQGLSGAVAVATESASGAMVAAMVGQLINMKYGRDDELESDQLGVRFLAEAGYDPRALVTVMRVLEASSRGGRPPEFFSTHPNPDRRVERIEAAIAATFPDGVPDGLDG